MSLFRNTLKSIVDLRSQVSSVQERLGEKNPALQTLQKVEAEVKQYAEKLQQTQLAMDGFRKRAKETDPEQRCYGPKMKAKVNDLCKLFDSLQVDVEDILSVTREKIAKELSVKAEAEATIAAAEKAEAEKAAAAKMLAEKNDAARIAAEKAAAEKAAAETAAKEKEQTELLTKLRLGIAEFKITQAPTGARLASMLQNATRRKDLTATLFGSSELSSDQVDTLLRAFEQLKQIAPDITVLYCSDSKCDLPSFSACTKDLTQSLCIHNAGTFLGQVSLTGSTFATEISGLLDRVDELLCHATANSVCVDRNAQPITLPSSVTASATASTTSTPTTTTGGGAGQSVRNIFDILGAQLFWLFLTQIHTNNIIISTVGYNYIVPYNPGPSPQ